MSVTATQYVDSPASFDLRGLWSALRSQIARLWRIDRPTHAAGLTLRDAAAREQATDFELPRVGGCECSLSDFAGRRRLLVFVEPHSRHSRRVAGQLNRIQASGDLQVLVIINCPPHEAGLWADDVLAAFPVLVQSDTALPAEYDVSPTRSAFVIDEQGRIAESGTVGEGLDGDA